MIESVKRRICSFAASAPVMLKPSLHRIMCFFGELNVKIVNKIRINSMSSAPVPYSFRIGWTIDRIKNKLLCFDLIFNNNNSYNRVASFMRPNEFQWLLMVNKFRDQFRYKCVTQHVACSRLISYTMVGPTAASKFCVQRSFVICCEHYCAIEKKPNVEFLLFVNIIWLCWLLVVDLCRELYVGRYVWIDVRTSHNDRVIYDSHEKLWPNGQFFGRHKLNVTIVSTYEMETYFTKCYATRAYIK